MTLKPISHVVFSRLHTRSKIVIKIQFLKYTTREISLYLQEAKNVLVCLKETENILLSYVQKYFV